MRTKDFLSTLLALLCASCTLNVQPLPVPNFSATLDQYIAHHPERQTALQAALDNPSRWENLTYKELKLVTNSRTNWAGERPQRFWGDTFYVDERRAEQCHSLDGVIFFNAYVVVIQSCAIVASIITSPHTLRLQEFVLTEPDLTVITARALLEQRITDGMTANEIKQLSPSVRFQETTRCDGKPIGECTVACNSCEVTLLINGISYSLENRGIFGVPRLKRLNPPFSLAPN